MSGRDGPGRDEAPYRLKGTEDGQGRGEARGVRRATTTEAPSSPAAALQLVRRRARREAACQLGRAAGPQERIQRRTVEQPAELAPMVQILDALVQQTVDQLVEVLRPLDTVVPEQVIEAPSTTSSRSAQFSLCRRWQNSWWTSPYLLRRRLRAC